MRQLDTKVEINEAQNEKLNTIIERCNVQIEAANTKLNLSES